MIKKTQKNTGEKKTQKKKKKKKEGKKNNEKRKTKKQKKRTSKGLVPKKSVRHPELVRFGPLFPTTFLHRGKRKRKKKAALPTLLCQPCFCNPVLPTLLCHLCFANPAWRTLIFRSIMFFPLFLKEAGWGIREVPSMSFYVFEWGRLGDTGGAVNVFLCFSLFFVSMFFCVFSVLFCVCSMFSVFFSMFFFCVFLCFCCLLKPNP